MSDLMEEKMQALGRQISEQVLLASLENTKVKIDQLSYEAKS